MQPHYGWKRVLDVGLACPVCASENGADLEEDDVFDYFFCRSCCTTGIKLKAELVFEFTEH
jgi:hypothetical protein